MTSRMIYTIYSIFYQTKNMQSKFVSIGQK